MIQEPILGKGEPSACSEGSLANLKTLSLIQLVFHRHVRSDGSLSAIGIKSLLEAEGVTVRSIADRVGVTEGFVHQVINRRRQSLKVEDAIAALFERYGLSGSQIWGRAGGTA